MPFVIQCKQPLLFRVSARLTPHNSAWPPNHHWHAADQAIIKETFSLCDVYWWEVMNKNNLNHFPSGLQENWMEHSFLLLPCFSRWSCFYFIIVNTALYFHLFSSLCSYFFCIPHHYYQDLLSSPSFCISAPLSPIQLLPPSNQLSVLECLSGGDCSW